MEVRAVCMVPCFGTVLEVGRQASCSRCFAGDCCCFPFEAMPWGTVFVPRRSLGL